MKGFTIFLFCSALFCMLVASTTVDTIVANQNIRDNDTIVSTGGIFELGFFTPRNSGNQYLGIWYKKISTGTVVWVANREIPLNNVSSILRFNYEGNLILLNNTNGIVWSSNSSRSAVNPVAQLLDTGNLVIRAENDSNPDNFFWQSFDYPCDNFLPGMKYGLNMETGIHRYLTSWKSNDDPSPGDYTNRVVPDGYPQLLLRNNSTVLFRSGPWNGLRYSGMPNLEPNSIYTYEFVFNQREIYYKYELINNSVFTRMALNPRGDLQRFMWIDRTQSWLVYLTAQMDDCDRYGLCGAYGSCNINDSPPCGCLDGFEPKFQEHWDVADWTHGCVREIELDCGNGDGFVRHSGVKLPDTRGSWFNESMNLDECERVCLENCSCTAYANTDIRRGGSGCLLWFNDLIDIREYTENGQDLFVRMAASELGRRRRPSVKIRLRIIIIPAVLIVTVILGLCLTFHIYIFKRRKVKREEGITRVNPESDSNVGNERENLDLPLLDLATLANATDNFSVNNKLGQGGFGPVYKGKLDEGQEIAVKRLSKNSRQGLDEFKNEVSCIAKLQHRNLVKLLGCCIDEEERMLIYEYMPNKSLDSFIFSKERSKSLDWPKRYNIINGIARGLLYLHQDSRLRIIHRDLKASNILLDCDKNPKISDFGLARSFGGSETEANTTRIVGTYGYMSPEYAIDGLFSVKSDVYSFGVLVLEIASGKKNRGFYHPNHNLNLLGHAWRLYEKGHVLELIDETIAESCNQAEVFRAIHIGLLCVQQYPEDRPNMSSVVLMLGSEIALSQPKQPGFFNERRRHHEEDSSLNSSNQFTVTFFAPR